VLAADKQRQNAASPRLRRAGYCQRQTQKYTMPDVGIHHQPKLAHHVRQGVAWLSANGAGDNTAALSYAASELRTAVERLAVHFWATLLDRKPEEQDLREIESFKRVAVDLASMGATFRSNI